MQKLTSFKHTVNRLITVINKCFHSYYTNNVNPEIWNSYYKSQISIWFFNNWDNLKAYANTLKHNKKYVTIIATVPITSYCSGHETNISKKDALHTVLQHLHNALLELNLKDTATLFTNSLTQLENFVKENNPLLENVNTVVKQHNVKVEQHNSMELILQEIISKLDKQHKHNAMLVIKNNANNKLKALQQYLEQNNLI